MNMWKVTHSRRTNLWNDKSKVKSEKSQRKGEKETKKWNKILKLIFLNRKNIEENSTAPEKANVKVEISKGNKQCDF